MYYQTCPDCGAYLDPGEVCDCKEKDRPSATNTETAKTEQTTRESH